MSVRPRMIVRWLMDMELPRVAATASCTGVNGSRPCVEGLESYGSGDLTPTATPMADTDGADRVLHQAGHVIAESRADRVSVMPNSAAIWRRT